MDEDLGLSEDLMEDSSGAGCIDDLSDASDVVEAVPVESRRLVVLKQASKVVGRALCGVTTACILTFLFLVLVGFGARVSSGSMEPTLMTDGFVFISRCQVYGSDTRGLEYGDIAVFRSHIISLADALDLKAGDYGYDTLSEFPVLMIKRVIGLPGDVIRIDSGVVYRNGVPLSEPYVTTWDWTSVSEFTVPEGEFFVLGDNRADSYDGRFWDTKTVPLETVVGEVVYSWV